MKRKIIPYNLKLKELANQLRKTMTLPEVLLWNELKQRKLKGYDFDRQRPIDNYIVDFYCKDLQLAIEIDGITHSYEGAFIKDEARQNKLENLGVNFLRFNDNDVKENMVSVIRTIEMWIEDKEQNLSEA